MSFSVFFNFSSGLSQTIRVPKGTKDDIAKHVSYIEETLNIEREQYLENPVHWKFSNYKEISDDILCKAAEEHNLFINRLFAIITHPNIAGQDFEEITPEEAVEFWPAMCTIDVPIERWNADYYRERMNNLYEALRGRDGDGLIFDAKSLSVKQAAGVILLLSYWLDKDDIRLDVPMGYDELLASYDGGYDWCEKCGAITFDDSRYCKRRKCPLIAERLTDED